MNNESSKRTTTPSEWVAEFERAVAEADRTLREWWRSGPRFVVPSKQQCFGARAKPAAPETRKETKA